MDRRLLTDSLHLGRWQDVFNVHLIIVIIGSTFAFAHARDETVGFDLLHGQIVDGGVKPTTL